MHIKSFYDFCATGDTHTYRFSRIFEEFFTDMPYVFLLKARRFAKGGIANFVLAAFLELMNRLMQRFSGFVMVSEICLMRIFLET